MEFVKGAWNEGINVRDFIQNNYTPYDGDESFLAAPTARTRQLWDELSVLLEEERKAREAEETYLAKLAKENSFRVEDMKQAFRLVGRRPELLAAIVQRVALDLGDAPNLGGILEESAAEIQAGVWAEYEAAYDPLTPAQKAVLMVMAESSMKKKAFAAYAEATVTRVGEIATALGSDARPTAQTIQAALEALREKDLVWRAGRGAYALEDGGMAEWLLSQR